MERINFHRGDIAAGGGDHFYDSMFLLIAAELVEDTNFGLTAKIGGKMYRADPEDLPCGQGTSVPLFPAK